MAGHSEYEGECYKIKRNGPFPDIKALMGLSTVGH